MDDVWKLIRTENALKALLSSDSTTEALIKIVAPFAKESKISGKPTFDWYEENIFNEERLYKALGKDDARSVLGVFRRFREVCEILERTNVNKS